MEELRRRRSTGTESRSTTGISSPDYWRPKLSSVGLRGVDISLNHDHQKQTRNGDRSWVMKMKMLKKVQVVYYLTRHDGQLQHPHYLEVSHLASQPLRLKDVTDRLAVLRGKAMPSQYSWSCKRSYKNGYVWNDLTGNDIIYASEGSEYVLKGSELIQDTDISETRAEEPQLIARQKGKNNHLVKHYKTNGWVMDTSNGDHQGHSFRQATNDHVEQRASKYSAEHIDHDEEEEDREEEPDDEEEKASCCNSSNAPYPPSNTSDCPLVGMQIEQEETYPLPSTSSTTSDKQPLPLTPPATPTVVAPKQMLMMPTVASDSESKRSEGKNVAVKGEGNPSTLTRNPVLLQLIACGGGSVDNANKDKPRSNAKANIKSFNFNTMRSTIIPCLKQQLSTKKERLGNAATVKMISNSNSTGVDRVALHKGKGVADHHQDEAAIDQEEEDEDMMMVRCMSENPRFGNLQSEEKEYFSGTIIEAIATHHQHTPSSASSTSALAHTQHHIPPPVISKSSSYNELRGVKAGLQEEALPLPTTTAEEDKGVNVRGVIKCIPRIKGCAYTCS